MIIFGNFVILEYTRKMIHTKRRIFSGYIWNRTIENRCSIRYLYHNMGVYNTYMEL